MNIRDNYIQIYNKYHEKKIAYKIKITRKRKYKHLFL